MAAKVKQFVAGSCYSYIISSGEEAVVIDPHISLGKEYSTYIEKNRLKLSYVIDTHTHADHFSLAAVLKKKYGVPVIMGEKAVSQVADKRMKDGDEIRLAGEPLKVIYTPGHTDDAISIYAGGAVFTGDVLMIESVGRTDFQNGSPESMFDSLQKLKSLPDATILYPGHDYNQKRSSTIAKEKISNPFLKETDKARFAATMRSKQLAKPFNIDNIIRVNQKGQAAGIEMVSVNEANKMAMSDPRVKLLDVRSASEFAEVHIKDAINMPVGVILSKGAELGASENTYIVLCHTGNRSMMAADMLMQSGVHSVKVMEGGMIEWKKARLPVIKGEGGISLERQVRIGAGILVLSGILLSWFVNQWFIGISFFVACGLVYAGITDNCMMGMLLMKLPYNKKLYKAKSGPTCSVS